MNLEQLQSLEVFVGYQYVNCWRYATIKVLESLCLSAYIGAC